MENIEERLREEKWLELWQLDGARLDAQASGRSLWASLVRMGYLSEEDIAAFLAQECGIPYVRVSDYAIDQSVLRLLEENFCIQNRIVPLFKIGNTLFIACSNPLDTALLDTAGKMTGLAIEPLVSGAHSILSALDLYWKMEEKNFELSRFVTKPNAVQGFVQWRQAERLNLAIPFELKVLDEQVNLLSRRSLAGNTFNISADGLTLGASTSVFLPKGLIVLLSFRIIRSGSGIDKLIEIRGEIIRSGMAKAKEYLLAVKLLNVSELAKKDLLSLVSLK
jgi:Type II secretion system (T2SS), protein E, N-terminal domain